MDTMLSGYRVLDLCDERGVLCGKILGDMGADVIKIERPGGDTARNVGPFYGGVPHRDRSLFWFAYNNNKRGITLDIETREGRRLLLEMARKADILLESFDTGYLEKLGLGYEALKEVNPRLIVTSITGFGQTGPYSRFKAPDMVVWALAGIMNMCGDADRPPIQVSQPEAYLAAATYAAEGALIALYERGTSGQGQRVDVSAQATMAWFVSELIPFWTFQKQDFKRAGQCITRTGGLLVPNIFACKDGYVGYLIQAGQPGAERNKKMAEWLDEEGFANDWVRNKNWDKFDWGGLTPDELKQLTGPLCSLFMAHTKQELFEDAVRRVISLFPVRTTQEIVESVQLQVRDFWVNLEHEELGATIKYPGPFTLLSETPITLQRRAPLVGEHNADIYVDELGLTPEEMVILQGEGVI